MSLHILSFGVSIACNAVCVSKTPGVLKNKFSATLVLLPGNLAAQFTRINVKLFQSTCKGESLMIMTFPETSQNQEVLVQANKFSQSGAPVGTVITEASGRLLFRIASYCYMDSENGIMEEACMLKALAHIAHGRYEILLVHPRCSIAIVTLSDKGAAGQRKDESGAVIENMLRQSLEIDFLKRCLLPDDAGSLKSLLCKLSCVDRFNMIITTGGTGVSSRDITPQVTSSLLTVPLPGIAQAMMNASLQKTPNAMISRATAGLIDKTLIINLPGSVKAVKENLAAILPGLPHCLSKINGDMTDCGLIS